MIQRNSKGQFLSKTSSWNKGISLTPEHKAKLRAAKLKSPVKYWQGKRRVDVAGESHWNWKGGRSVQSNGYVYLAYSTIKPAYQKYFTVGRIVAEHDYVWVLTHRRAIPKGYHVHHLDRIKTNNEPVNLTLLSGSDHSRWHALHKRRKE